MKELHDDHDTDFAEGTISVSGVQEKLSAIEENGLIRLTRQGEQGKYIIKHGKKFSSFQQISFLTGNLSKNR